MGRLSLSLALLFFSASAALAHTWKVVSPDHRQTFSYGSERHRQWIARNNHLAIVIHFTNDPYVDQVNFRQYDDLDFNFPNVTLASGGRIFYYHPPGRHRPIPVAVEHPGFLGPEIQLLSSNTLAIQKTHGLLTLVLVVSDSSPSL